MRTSGINIYIKSRSICHCTLMFVQQEELFEVTSGSWEGLAGANTQFQRPNIPSLTIVSVFMGCFYNCEIKGHWCQIFNSCSGSRRKMLK